MHTTKSAEPQRPEDKGATDNKLDASARKITSDLFSEKAPAMRRQATGALGAVHQADDVVEDAFLSFFTTLLAKGSEIISPKGLLQRIFRRTLADHRHGLTKQARLAPLDDELPAPDESGPIERRHQIDQVLALLPREDQELLVRRYRDGETSREIAESIGTSEDAAEKKVQRLLKRVRGGLRGESLQRSEHRRRNY